MPDNAASELQGQWSNPGDILSLLLLIGGDIVQKAIAQLVGYTIRPFGKNGMSIGIAPVAFSFGWVGYGFTNLLSIIGEKSLMPPADGVALLVNCSNAFSRVNQSWALGRLLRDHEASHEVDATDPLSGQLPSTSPQGRAESIRIDIFELGVPSKPSLDLVWWLGWVTIGTQIGIAIPPWVVNGNWGVMLVVLCGNFLALLTTALPQWRQEKWAGRTLEADKVTCLTRGNGHLHIMVFLGHKGSWDLETLATGSSKARPETPVISLILALLWTCLLISVSGLKEHAWYLVGIGGIGMLQNIYAAGTARNPSTANFHLTEFSPMPTIIGKRQPFRDAMDSNVDLKDAMADVSKYSTWIQSMDSQIKGEEAPVTQVLDSVDWEYGIPEWLKPLATDKNKIENVQGALIELEKWVPTAGLAMLQIYFPSHLRYQDGCIRNNVHKKFWQRAYHTARLRKKVVHQRRRMERSRQLGGEKGPKSGSSRQVDV
ncbi:hypothetical protein BP5796_04261 [Coleophoma crateriformis]|uniref:Uncharacterized protein n=1 Tax=Coleophoma crateriformis TaxID=565419 RepID=A0A3D8SHZ8_9HELO|nr:hypothetical protein BP5796_04261 [Coleophoma crateriformis]